MKREKFSLLISTQIFQVGVPQLRHLSLTWATNAFATRVHGDGPVDPYSRQTERRNYLKRKYKSMNHRFKNYQSLGLQIEVSGFRDLSGMNLETGQSEKQFLRCPFCKISEPCPHCPE